VLKLATLFWADVRFIFRNSAKPFRASPSVEVTPSHRTNGLQGATFQRMFSSCRFSAPSHSRNSSIRHEWTSQRRWLASQKSIGYSSYDRSWEDEALQDAMLSRSQRQCLPVSLKGCGVSVHDESLRAASPLHSSVSGYSAPRFDWRRRAMSRAAHGHKSSCDGKHKQTHSKRLVPQQRDIQPGGRFYHEVKAYEDRWVLLSCLQSL
jgi:hypothetical protein